MRMNPSFYKIITMLHKILLLLLLSASLSAEPVRTVPTGQLNLVATIDGKPAFRDMTWTLRREGESGKAVETTLHRHIAVLHLKPGVYKVSATLNEKTRTKTVTIREGGKHALELKMD